MSTEDDKQTVPLATVEATQAKRSTKLIADSDIASLQDINISLRSVLDQTGTYIFTKDTAGRYTFVNQMIQDLFGASFEEIIGKDDSHFFALELANELYINDRLVIDLGESVAREETNIVKATGDMRIYWTVKKPLRNDKGQIIGLCGISTDITQRKALDNALRESEAHLRLSQTSGGIGTWEADLVNNRQKWSKNCTVLLGFTDHTEPKWDDFLNFVFPEDRQKVIEATRLHIESGVPYDVEYRTNSTDGSIRWLRSAGQVERDATGNPKIMRGIVQNVTERHKNQHRIEQLLAEQKAIVENPLVGICTTRQRKIALANATFDTMFGYDKGELLGSLTRKLYLSEEDYQAIGATYANIGSYEILRTQHEFLRKDGRHIWLDMSGAILHKETNEFLWIFVDVTDRKLAETQKEKSLSLLYATLESTNDSILVVDLNNTWVLHNQRFLDLWEITDDILAAKNDSDALSYVLNQLEDASVFLTKVNELYTTPELSSFDILHFKNGKIIERYSIPQRIDNKVVGRVWSFRDVTERTVIELALKRESEKNLALLHNASDGIHILDFNGNIIEASNSFCNMLGYQRDEIIGMNAAQWDANFIGGKLLELVRQQFEKQGRTQFETRHRRKDGTIFQVEVSGFPLELDGKPVLFNSSRDITERKQAEKRLVDSENKYRSLIDLASDAIFLVDTVSGIIIDCNKHATELLGKSKNEIIGAHQANLHPAETTSRYQNLFKSHIDSAQDFTEDLLVVHKDGHTIPVDITTSIIKLGDTSVILAIFRDITTHKQKTDELNRTKKRYELVTTIGKIGIWDWNCLNGDLVWNDETFRIFGLDAANTRPSYGLYISMLHEEDRMKIEKAVHESLYEKKSYNENCRIILKNGEERICHTTGEVEYNDSGEPVRMLGTFQDISGQKKTEAELKHIAYYDGLTRLPNRVLLADRLHQAMTLAHRSGQQLAVAFLDLDGFKTINDNYGHETGDQLLVTLANRMKLTLREGDTLARLGGDEFVAVLLELEDVKSSVPMLNRLLTAAAEPIHIGDLALNVSASLGVTFYPQAEDIDADQLLRQSDQAMYQAKLGGKNRYHIFDAKQDSSIRFHHESLEHIRYALNEREFVLFYQPKVNMRTGTVIGAEALIRWQHPDLGLLQPALFLPVIEDHPLAVEIGDWVIDTVLTQIEDWHAAGLHIPVSINVSAHHLQQPDFVTRLQAMLAAHPQVTPYSIDLEILETSALEDLAGVSRVIEACREIGVLFALDDFGTGYSSLTYLKRLPVTLLKIDQSFVCDMLEDPDDLAILQGILGLATAFHRDVIAEGVETIEHGQMLLQLGCDLAQGYGIARPMPAEQIPDWVATWRTDPSWGNLSSISRDDLPLLFAGIEHLAWISAIEKHLKHERAAPPQMNQHQCNFGAWLAGNGLKRHGTKPAFKAVASLHTQVHIFAAELLKLHGNGHNLEALARLSKLHDLKDLLTEQLKNLAQEDKVNY